MGLTQKILLFTSLLVIAVVGTSLTFSTIRAARLAEDAILAGLRETRDVWSTFQADRFNRLALGVRVLANDAPFKAAIQTDRATVFDMLQERGQDLGADFVVATDPAGVVIARSDRPTDAGEDLSEDPLVMRPLTGEDSATVWRQAGRLYHAVSVSMRFGANVVGVLIAGYAIDEALANQIRRLTRSEIAYLIRTEDQRAELIVSSLGPREAPLRAALTRPEFTRAEGTPDPFELDLGNERHMGVVLPLTSLAGESVGAVVVLRSLRQEMAAFSQFRNSLVWVSLAVMLVGLAVAYVAASRMTGPLRALSGLVEKARDGSYSGAVNVTSSDEIGTLGRVFNQLLTDLREKEQMIQFLRESITVTNTRSTTSQPPRADAMDATVLMAGRTSHGVQEGAVFAGRFEILEMLGEGGMGVVYRARDRQLDEIVALKVLHQELIGSDPTLLDRFKQEIKLARKITHRNVVRTHDFGESQGVPYISMEYVKGVTLKTVIRSKGALPIPLGLRIAKQICQGLDAAHSQGVVHRDIKPQNMLILRENGDLKIMDFGIARLHTVTGEATAPGLTTRGMILGTPHYMSPEQGKGEAADFRSDIYSVGVVLFEVFSGTLPFDGDLLMTVVTDHIRTPPRPPRTINPVIPVDLDAIILRCLEKDPSRRYQGVTDLFQELNAVSISEASVA